MPGMPELALPVALGLDDEHPAVQLTALVTIGKMRFVNSAPPRSLR
ncbi:MAG: hypothetical protein R3C45_06190 [Phycisphaerales bacterium]